jgi:hypothetical protein
MQSSSNVKNKHQPTKQHFVSRRIAYDNFIDTNNNNKFFVMQDLTVYQTDYELHSLIFSLVLCFHITVNTYKQGTMFHNYTYTVLYSTFYT